MRRTLGNLILLIIVGAVAYAYRGPLAVGWTQLYSRYFPCKQPLTYSIGSFDTRFGMTKEKFLEAVKEAEAIWETPVKKELFAYAPEGKLTINLVFDYRQEATEKMQALGLSVDDDQASYDALRAKYAALKQEFQARKAEYDSVVASVEERHAAYNAEVAQWNNKKGAPKDVYDRLNAESAALKVEVTRIRSLEGELREVQESLNALVTVINQVANNINASADEFNRIGKERGEEFTEGLYTSDRSGQKIDIFQFSDRKKLVRVLAHELGHALALEHVEDPKAIMYRLNQGTNSELAEADIAAVKTQCKME